MDGVIPRNLSEALEAMAHKKLKPYSGGTDLMVGEEEKENFLFLHRIEELRQITEDEQYIHVGPGCTFTEIERAVKIPSLLREAVAQVAAPAIRNLGTIGGNIGNGSAKADSALALTALEAVLCLSSVRGMRKVPIWEFYLGKRELDKADDELLTDILIPKAHIGPYYYEKVGARNALAISRVSFAGIMVWKEEKVAFCSTAFGAVNDVILHMRELDHLMVGKTYEQVCREAERWKDNYKNALHPQRGRISAEYRKTVCMNLLSEFVDKCVWYRESKRVENNFEERN